MSDDFAQARRNMVEGQIKPNGVLNPRLLAALAAIPREDFVTPASRALAYAEIELPLGEAGGRRMLSPLHHARLLEHAAIGEDDRALVVGAGLGYGAAALARIAAGVVAVEEDEALARDASARLLHSTVAVRNSAHAAGDVAGMPYDAIIVEGRIEVEPVLLLDQLTDGGRLAAIMGSANAARICVWRRRQGGVQRAVFEAATAGLLPGFAKPPQGFAFF